MVNLRFLEPPRNFTREYNTIFMYGEGRQLVVHVLFLTDFSEQVYVFYRHPASSGHINQNL
jgi:hypothetical protein